jgi:hypothetical protein
MNHAVVDIEGDVIRRSLNEGAGLGHPERALPLNVVLRACKAFHARWYFPQPFDF